MRPAHLFSILDREFSSAVHGHHTPVMLWGPPGVGKSQIVAEVAARRDVPVIDVRLSQMEPSDLRGIPFRTGEHVEWAVPAMLPDAERHGPRGILFLDEITSAAPTVSAAAYQLILDRRLGAYRIPAGWAIFAAGNRQGDRGVTYAMPAPLANRFAHFELEVNLDDWVAWAYVNGIDERVIAFLRFRPDLLFDFDPAHNPVAFPSPRSWEFAHRALQKFGGHPDVLVGGLQACVGPAAGIELHAFVENLDNLPDLDAILRGDEVPVPQTIDLQYAVASSLVARAIRARGTDQGEVVIGRILDYAGRFPQREMGVMLVSDLHRAVGEALFAVPQFSDWASQVADLMLYDG
ncbi:ATPase family protein associated with various cellular activities (AAA) [Thioflavicoccus mobilis 8321]|uniref:ATPase family protein associated with various cellular activities (AAA) n=1 Tax=Thioflavicoccus mobilis 8321 TaxID=765912 RepID=L0GX33_9GAMM|nr:MoxR family ATPase [Thioflavicoccus mobilis]AGA90521.1 ATPase family protein associated with various cellular activities (AAA) [Thioflavicoccus mobilis 8321]